MDCASILNLTRRLRSMRIPRTFAGPRPMSWILMCIHVNTLSVKSQAPAPRGRASADSDLPPSAARAGSALTHSSGPEKIS